LGADLANVELCIFHCDVLGCWVVVGFLENQRLGANTVR
jgi:hypothetical protein